MSEAATETTTEQVTATETTTQTEEPTETLGDAGKKALDAMKAKWKAAEAKAKANEDAAQRLADLEEASTSETEKAVAAARKEGEKVATERVNSRLIRAEARAAAAALGFADPSDVALADLSEVTVDNEGEVDAEAVKAALAELVEKKPHLLKKTADTSATDAGIGAAGSVAIDGSPQSLIRAGLAQTSKTK